MEHKLKLPVPGDPVFVIICTTREPEGLKETIHHWGTVVLRGRKLYCGANDGKEYQLPDTPRLGGKLGSLWADEGRCALAYSVEDAGLLAARILTQSFNGLAVEKKRAVG